MTKDELNLARTHRANIIYDALQEMKGMRYNVGDFLIKKISAWDSDLYEKDSSYDGHWKIETFSETNPAPRKYKVVAIDDVGIPYIQKVLFNGKLQGEVTCILNADPDYIKYELDPDFADHFILSDDENFDPLDSYKVNKQNGTTANKA